MGMGVGGIDPQPLRKRVFLGGFGDFFININMTSSHPKSGTKKKNKSPKILRHPHKLLKLSEHPQQTRQLSLKIPCNISNAENSFKTLNTSRNPKKIFRTHLVLGAYSFSP